MKHDMTINILKNRAEQNKCSHKSVLANRKNAIKFDPKNQSSYAAKTNALRH